MTLSTTFPNAMTVSTAPVPFVVKRIAIGSLQVPLWEPAHGPVPDVFDHKPRGHRCFWSCHYATGLGRVTADHLLPLSQASDLHLFYELADIAQRVPFAQAAIQRAARQQLRFLRYPPVRAWDPVTRQAVKDVLWRARGFYAEYVLPTDPPRAGVVFRPVWRPGYGPQDLTRPEDLASCIESAGW